MNKTIVACTGIVTFGITCITIAGLYIYFYSSKTETRDRVTVCIDTVMMRSNEANKPISAKEAREICG